MIEISIANQFSRYPAGRTTPDGPDNGRRFRTELLAPALSQAIDTSDQVIIDLEGVRSFGSSFLEEAFGGIVRNNIASKEDVKKHISIVFTTPVYKTYARLIEKYIDEAHPT